MKLKMVICSLSTETLLKGVMFLKEYNGKYVESHIYVNIHEWRNLRLK